MRILSQRPRATRFKSLTLFLVTMACATLLILVYNRTWQKETKPNQQINSSVCQGCEVPMKRLPQAIIIGARKSGTRALLKFLELNPHVKAAKSEIHFFDKPQNYKLGLEWYKNQMPESYANQVTIEKSPAYFVTKGVPERIHSMNSSIKLILIMRNPVIRLISDFSQLVANKIRQTQRMIEPEYNSKSNDYEYDSDREPVGYSKLNTSNFNETESSIWSSADHNFIDYITRSDGGIDQQRAAIKVGMYSLHLEKWRSIFPLGQFIFVDGENLINNPHDELQKLEMFLGIKPNIRADDFVFNHKKGFFCIANKNISKLEGNVRKTRLLRSIDKSDVVPKHICLSKSKGRRHVNVSKEILITLNDFYKPYNEYLTSLTGKDFNWSHQNIQPNFQSSTYTRGPMSQNE